MAVNQKFQNCLDEIRQIAGVEAALFGESGRSVAENMKVPASVTAEVPGFLKSSADQETIGDFMLFKVMVEEEPEYILAIRSSRDDAYILGQMSVCQIRTIAMSMREQLDRNRYMQNLILGNMLSVDVMSRAKKLHITDRPRVVYVIDTGSKSTDMVVELVKNLSDMKAGDFVTTVDANNVILIRDLSDIPEKEVEQELEEYASLLVDTLHMEAMIKVRVGYGNVCSTIHGIPQSYQEAKLALEVGRVFYEQKDTVCYGRLGIGRLIYQLPTSLCDMFIREVFGDKIPEILSDEEAMSTINKFFDNNLNISETARQLYVHRNTLVYRLERIQKSIGLDIRVLDDAMTFRIATMVLAHLRNSQKE